MPSPTSSETDPADQDAAGDALCYGTTHERERRILMGVRLANAHGRGSLVVGSGLVDVERASTGRFSPDPMALLERWDVFLDWARGLHEGHAEAPANEGDFGPPVPRPRKVFAIGVNYRAHAAEA